VDALENDDFLLFLRASSSIFACAWVCGTVETKAFFVPVVVVVDDDDDEEEEEEEEEEEDESELDGCVVSRSARCVVACVER